MFVGFNLQKCGLLAHHSSQGHFGTTANSKPFYTPMKDVSTFCWPPVYLWAIQYPTWCCHITVAVVGGCFCTGRSVPASAAAPVLAWDLLLGRSIIYSQIIGKPEAVQSCFKTKKLTMWFWLSWGLQKILAYQTLLAAKSDGCYIKQIHTHTKIPNHSRERLSEGFFKKKEV